MRAPSPGYARFAWATLLFTLFVILWGAFVLVRFLSEDPAEKDPDPDEASTGNEG